MAPELIYERLVSIFPALASTQFEITSSPTTDYNCVAWAAGQADHWWWPGRFWPRDVPAATTRLAFVKAFAQLGYDLCDGPAYEIGFEKVCIYEKMGRPTHAARQLPNGLWTSKLGNEHDISHELEGLTGKQYGKPSVYLRRAITNIVEK